MAARIEDYALLGDTHTTALVSRDGSVDWLCLPRIDSAACFAALLGTPEHGFFRIAPAGLDRGGRSTRRYLDGSLVLETEHTTDQGTVRVTDLMPVRGDGRSGNADLVRIVEGVRGHVDVEVELAVRFDYGSVVPWVRRRGPTELTFVAGPDALALHTHVPLHGEGFTSKGSVRLGPGDRVPFVLTWHASHERAPRTADPEAALADTLAFWSSWQARARWSGPWVDPVHRSLATLKALTYAPTGGVVAAATTSLPEALGGVRNWDYRYCWLRDASLTLDALLAAGHVEEAGAFRDWLLRAAAGRPEDLQVLYGPRGERRLTEVELPWLPGYEGSAPVRVGNAAHGQRQLDVYGEVLDVLAKADQAGLPDDDDADGLRLRLLEWLEGEWRGPDEGVWEVRGGRRRFTHSKVLCWVAFDRAASGGVGPDPARWRARADEVRAEVLAEAVDPATGAFTQSYGSPLLDAAVLLIPQVGFLPATDPRVVATVEQVERRLVERGFVRRYEADRAVDGLPEGEGAFLPCTFWLADVWAEQGRVGEARHLFEQLLALRNDVGLLSEEVDPASGRLLGNFPQAWSHTCLVNTATRLAPLATPPPAAGAR